MKETEAIDLFVSESCNEALEECEEYLKAERKGNLSDDELRIMAEKIIYKKAVANTIKTLKYFKLL
jgi:oligoribonuclease NrnB/cAMP/cGMP phosphodiesterase (DHH superfamily)